MQWIIIQIYLYNCLKSSSSSSLLSLNHHYHLENVNDMLCSRHISDAMITNDNERWTITTSFFHTKHQFYTHVLILKFNSLFSPLLPHPLFKYGTLIGDKSIILLSHDTHLFLHRYTSLFLLISYHSSQFVITTHQMPF